MHGTCQSALESFKVPGAAQSERVDITAGASPSGHYDPKNDVILSLEVMGATQTRVRILRVTHKAHVPSVRSTSSMRL